MALSLRSNIPVPTSSPDSVDCCSLYKVQFAALEILPLFLSMDAVVAAAVVVDRNSDHTATRIDNKVR